MGVDARWENEQGAALETLDDPHNLVAQLLPDYGDAAFPCLRFVDLYGDTVFNQLQIPLLLDELHSLGERSLAPPVHAHLVALTELVQKAAGEVHTYIRFYGD
jgi:hypothetical protein